MGGFDAVSQGRYILHVDADAFFVSIEESLNPELKGKAVAVGSSSKRGIVCAASYEARRYGIHSGMSSRKAFALYPDLLMISPQFDVYRFFSQRLFEILHQYSPHVEKTSIDEGYVDLTGTTMMWGMSAKDLAMHILKQIYGKLKIPVSGGLASGKLVAQVASKLYKPHKLTYIPTGYEKQFLWPLPLEVIPGVGKKSIKKFNSKGIFEVRHFGDLPLEKVIKDFDLHAVNLWQKIHGFKKDQVQTTPHQAKSISHETTFETDLDDIYEVKQRLIKLINKVLFRLRQQNMQASVISLKMRSANFHTYTFHRKLSYPTSFDGDIIDEGKFLLRQNFQPHRPLRLIGFGVEKLQKEYNLSIFQQNLDMKNRMMEHIDKLRKQYGFGVVSYGA